MCAVAEAGQFRFLKKKEILGWQSFLVKQPEEVVALSGAAVVCPYAEAIIQITLCLPSRLQYRVEFRYLPRSTLAHIGQQDSPLLLSSFQIISFFSFVLSQTYLNWYIINAQPIYVALCI